MIQRAAESSTAMTWRQLHDLLGPIKAVRYTTEGRTIVQSPFKKLLSEISLL